MEEKDKQPQKPAKFHNAKELPITFGSLTAKERWDLYFAIKSSDDFSEWYVDWHEIEDILIANLVYPLSVTENPHKEPPESDHSKQDEMSILVPACGDSRLSEHLYDAGFRNIMNVDYSKVVITAMLRRNVIQRPRMKWRVMDMASMQFDNETFDAIVDKGGLDVLMDPDFGQMHPNIYITKVKELLKVGGKYICFTLGEPKVLDLLFNKFRFGWKVNLYVVDQEPSSRNLDQQTFKLVAEKDGSTFVYPITLLMVPEKEALQVDEAVKRENAFRQIYMNTPNIFYPLEDLLAKENFTELQPGRRVKLKLGNPGVSRLIYKGILLDARRDSGPFSDQFRVFILPDVRTLQWVLSSEEGQWVYVGLLKVARLLMIILDAMHACFAIEDIQSDLSPLVKQLAPRDCDDVDNIPCVVASDGIEQREILYEVTSILKGPIVVDDVIYGEIQKVDDALSRHFPHKDLKIRRLIVRNLVKSEAVLTIEGPNRSSSKVERDSVQADPQTRRKKGKKKKSDSSSSRSHGKAPSGDMIHHNYLDSLPYNGIISGLMLLSLHLKGSTSSGVLVKTVVIGLKAGLLPMFMKNCLLSLHIEVVEEDPVFLDVAREYFGFTEDERLKVHITNDLEFLNKRASKSEEDNSLKVDMLVVDVDAPFLNSAMVSPAARFLKESFLLTAKHLLSEEGLLVVHLVSGFPGLKAPVYSRLKKVFGNIFSLELEEDTDEVIFALKTESVIKEDELSEACDKLVRSLELEKPEWRQRVIIASKLIKPLIC